MLSATRWSGVYTTRLLMDENISQQANEPTSMEKEAYPDNLLPKKQYKLRIPTSDVSSHFLIRKSLGDIYDSDGEILIDSVLRSARESFGLSCNLFSNYEVSHLAYRCTDGILDENWDGNADCQVGDNQFIKIHPEEPLFFSVAKLHERRVPYQKPGKPERGKPPVNVDFEATCELVHKPTICNYWHFEVHFKDAEEKFIRYSGSEWQKKLAEFLPKSFFLKAIQAEIPPQNTLSKDAYIIEQKK